MLQFSSKNKKTNILKKIKAVANTNKKYLSIKYQYLFQVELSTNIFLYQYRKYLNTQVFSLSDTIVFGGTLKPRIHVRKFFLTWYTLLTRTTS